MFPVVFRVDACTYNCDTVRVHLVFTFTFMARARTPGLRGTEGLRSPCTRTVKEQIFIVRPLLDSGLGSL
jgi:hypothetical protein